MKNWLKIILILAVIGIAAILVIYFFVYNKPHKDIEKAKAEYTLEAKALYDEYLKDKKKADSIYNGKVIEIRGTFTKTESSDSTAVIIFVFNEGMFGDEGIRCSLLDKYIEKSMNLKSGMNIRIKGFCSGYNETDVILEKCSIVE